MADPVQAWVEPGPDALARGLVIAAGATIAAPWRDAARIVVDQAVIAEPESTVAMLMQHAAAGRRVVIELVAPFALSPRSTESDPPYALGARFWFPLDVLHHLVWSNAIDASGTEPHWTAIDRAVELGATIPADSSTADVILPSGAPAWIDGGPIRRRLPIDGHPVLHSVALEHGSLTPPSDSGSTADLADDQRAAVSHLGAAARIIAPAGSGKTRVLTERARHLLNDWHVPPTAVSMVAFNKRAQEEMQARTPDLRGLRVRTLNAIALAIVNGTSPFLRQPRQLRTIDEIEVRRLIGRLVQFPRQRNTDPVAQWMEALSAIRLGLRDPRDVEEMYNGDVDGLADVWPRYRAALDRDGVLDFDEQVYRAIELLLTDADARAAAQRVCRLMLIDEFQDLTPAHVLLVRLLSAPGFGVFGVGDDDQTIYGYSGADPAWLIDFASLFPEAGAHPLEINYRCPGDVVQAADRLVRHNRRRVAKVIRSIRPDSTGLQVIAARDTLGATVSAVAKAVAAGRRPADVAVLTRVNAMLAPVQMGLLATGIPVRGGVGKEFVERTAVRSALAWIRLSVSTSDQLEAIDLAEALRRPSRPMHPNVATWVAEQSTFAGLRRLAGRVNNERDASRIAQFVDDIGRLQRLAATGTTTDVLRTLADEIGLGASIATLDDGRHGMNRAAQNDDLVALAQLATLQPDPARFGVWLREQLAAPRSNDGVTLATVHRVKGQEWPMVVLHHAEADQYPHRLAEDFEEERRVFHVAITRGAEQVVVIAGNEPSPFIEQMLHEPPERLAELPPQRPTTVTPVPKGKSPARDTPFDKGVVFAAPGLVLVDGGQEWTIEIVEEQAALARLGTATRRFNFGGAVTTPGRQRGPLRPAPTSGPNALAAASIRAHDLLRQSRERLRSGKPAYVVFDDKTLEAIALRLPLTSQDLGRIPGIGPAKLEQYGDAVLLAIEDALSTPE
ncbi:MAG: ATP-dependent DNA helicase UvrD2 [Ilumatobacteraceae bacterium]